MKTIKYLEEAKKRLGIKSDYALAKNLGLKKQTVSGYTTGTRIMDDYTAARIAKIITINPLEVISAANAEREKDRRRREFWEAITKEAMESRGADNRERTCRTILEPLRSTWENLTMSASNRKCRGTTTEEK